MKSIVCHEMLTNSGEGILAQPLSCNIVEVLMMINFLVSPISGVFVVRVTVNVSFKIDEQFGVSENLSEPFNSFRYQIDVNVVVTILEPQS